MDRVLDSPRSRRVMPAPAQPTRIDQSLALAVLAVLIVGCYLVMQPFMTAIVWAAILAATVWPLHARLRARLRGRESLAALVTVLCIATILLAPFVIVGATVHDHAGVLIEFARGFAARGAPDPPPWVASVPLVGQQASAYWSSLAHDTARALDELRKLADPARKYLLAGGATVLGGLLQLALSVLLAFFLLKDGEKIVRRLEAAIERIAPARGARLIDLAGQTVRGVVFGILGTALAQGVLMAIGAAVAGLDTAPLLGLLVFLLSPVPVGPPLIWGGAALWLFSEGQTGWAIAMVIWGAGVVSTVDNLVRPLLISQGTELPFILVLLGVIGGAVAFGVIGLFLGPVLLAVGYVLLREWASVRDEAAPSTGAGTPGAKR